MLIKTDRNRRIRSRNVRTDNKGGDRSPPTDPLRSIQRQLASSLESAAAQQRFLASLRTAHRRTLRRLFHTLSPPTMESLAGEYDAELLDQGGSVSQLVTQALFGMHGNWLGKGFCPLNDRTGVGYNYFQHEGTIIRKLPMCTRIEDSTLDDGTSLTIRYTRLNRGLIRWLLGEVRQVTSGVMLGIGIFGPAHDKPEVPRRHIPFMMIGPIRPYEQTPVA